MKYNYFYVLSDRKVFWDTFLEFLHPELYANDIRKRQNKRTRVKLVQC